MGDGAAGGLGHQHWSPSWPPSLIFSRSSWFYQELEISLKPPEIATFCALHEKWHINKHLNKHDFSQKNYFCCWKKLNKTCIFTQKWLDHLLPMTSYLITIATDHHWPCQNVCEGWTNSYWKRQVLMFYPLGKNSKKPWGGGGGGIPLPRPLVRPSVNSKSRWKLSSQCI